jgi:hypothetical protein
MYRIETSEILQIKRVRNDAKLIRIRDNDVFFRDLVQLNNFVSPFYRGGDSFAVRRNLFAAYHTGRREARC